jgi:hypothetical protein
MGGDAFAVPPQPRLRSHDPVIAESAGERDCDGAEQAPVIVVDGWAVDLSAEYLNLVAEHHDLEVFGASGTDSESNKPSQKTVEHVKREAPAWRHLAWSTPTRSFPSPTRPAFRWTG